MDVLVGAGGADGSGFMTLLWGLTRGYRPSSDVDFIADRILRFDCFHTSLIESSRLLSKMLMDGGNGFVDS